MKKEILAALLICFGSLAHAIGRGSYGTPLNGSGQAVTPTSVNTGSVIVPAANTTDASALSVNIATFSVWGSTLTVLPNGNVGIGTGTPTGQMSIHANTLTTVSINSYGTSPNALLIIRGATGTKDAPTALAAGKSWGQIQWNGYGATAFSGARAAIIVTSTEAFTDTAQGTTMGFQTTRTGTAAGTTHILIGADGQMGLGEGGAVSAPSAVVEITSATASSTVNLLRISTGTGVGAKLITVSVANGFVASAGTPVTFSSAAFVGTFVSTQAAGSAGTAVTATCLANTYAQGGGCSCTGGVAITSVVNQPNCQTQGCIPNGWTCQDAGGTGAACAAFAVCSRLQ